MNYPSMKIVIANSICNVAVSRFPHRQASVVAKKKKEFLVTKIARKMSTYGRPPCTYLHTVLTVDTVDTYVLP